jgi:hypothetical protein
MDAAFFVTSRISHGDEKTVRKTANYERYALPLKVATGGMILRS